MSNEPLEQEKTEIGNALMSDNNLNEKDLDYFVKTGSISNAAYMASDQKIKILKKDKSIVDIEDTADLPNIKAISKIVTKYYLCWAKNVSLTKT